MRLKTKFLELSLAELSPSLFYLLDAIPSPTDPFGHVSTNALNAKHHEFGFSHTGAWVSQIQVNLGTWVGV